jgi:hypothetical protein
VRGLGVGGGRGGAAGHDDEDDSEEADHGSAEFPGLMS